MLSKKGLVAVLLAIAMFLAVFSLVQTLHYSSQERDSSKADVQGANLQIGILPPEDTALTPITSLGERP